MRLQPACMSLALAAFCVLTTFLCGPRVFAQVLLSDGETTIIDAASASVEVRNGPGGAADATSLVVVSGADLASLSGQSIGLFENSILQMSDGNAAGAIVATDSASVDMSGGRTLSEVLIAGNATGVLSGNSRASDVRAIDNGVATINSASMRVDDDLISEDAAVINVQDIFVDDDVAAADDSIMNLMGGLYDEDVTASDNAVISISGGTYQRVFSRGASLSAIEASISVTGGVFGQAGFNDGGSALATLGGTLNFHDAEIAGVNTGNAPTATFSAVLNGEIHLSNTNFGDLRLEARNSGLVTAHGYSADQVDVVASAGGTVNLLGSGADGLSINAELAGIVNLLGGEFGDINAVLSSQGVLNVIGHSFRYNNIPLENVDAVFGPGGYVPSTGEVRFVAGLLSGILANGDPFELSFQRQFTAGARLFVQVVPEPCTVALGIVVAVSLVCLRRN